MHRFRAIPIFTSFVFATCLWSHAATMAAGGTRADYERAAKLPEMARNRVFRQRVAPQWINGGPKFWYRVQIAANQSEFVFVDPAKPIKRAAFDHDRLAAALGKSAKQDVDPKNLPFKSIKFAANERLVEFRAFNSVWQCDLTTYEVKKGGISNSPNQSTVIVHDKLISSRNRGAETWVKFHNRTDHPVELLWVQESGELKHYKNIKPGQQHNQHTYAGHVWLVRGPKQRTLAVMEAVAEQSDAIIDEKLPAVRSKATAPKPKPDAPPREWDALIKNHNVFLRHKKSGQEKQLSNAGNETNRFSGRFTWSPNGNWLVAIQRKEVKTREVHLIESSPKDQLQPKLHTHRYAKPGDPLPTDRPRLFDIKNQREITFSETSFENPWSISDIRWAEDSSRFYFLFNQRGHQALRLISVATDGTVKVIIDESSSTFVDYANKKYSHHLKSTDQVIWMSERDGWNHLYLINAVTGDVDQQITKGEWVVRGVDRVDEESRQIWFRASGLYPDQDPYYIHYCRVDMDGRNLVRLTDGDGTHEVEYSPDREFLIARYSRVDLPPVVELRRVSDGKRVLELERADWSELLATGWRAPERFSAKGRDGKTDIHGIIHRPTTFNKESRYPVIEHIYAGPHGSHVPKRFSELHKPQMLAELGFIVVRIDGMGTSNRSKAFHDVAWQNLGDAGFPDRLLWIKAAAAKYPQLDLDRVGIYGGSAGGQNSLRGLLMYPDFYKAAVADCGCHDNRMDKVWWNELWMSWPIGPHYADASNVTHAHRLQGKLLLIVGELDRNVDPASTMQVVNALVKADKDFDLLVMPGTGHGAAETKYGTRRRRDFFVRHLLNVEPRRP